MCSVDILYNMHFNHVEHVVAYALVRTEFLKKKNARKSGYGAQRRKREREQSARTRERNGMKENTTNHKCHY